MADGGTDLDALLDQALDDFEDQELKNKAADLQADHDEEEANKKARDREALNVEKLQELLANMEDKRFGHTLSTTMKDLSGTSQGNDTVEGMFQQMAEQYQTDHKPSYMPSGPDDDEGMSAADRQVAAAMQMMGRAQNGMQGLDVNKMEETGETMMDEMMQQFEALGEKEDYNVSVCLFPGHSHDHWRYILFALPAGA
jgi:hypothetical protein